MPPKPGCDSLQNGKCKGDHLEVGDGKNMIHQLSERASKRANIRPDIPHANLNVLHVSSGLCDVDPSFNTRAYTFRVPLAGLMIPTFFYHESHGNVLPRDPRAAEL